MESTPFPSSPPGIVAIASFWVILGAWVLSVTSQIFSESPHQETVGLILIFISVGLIALGWGLLTYRRWAYITAFILSLLCLIPFVFLVFNLVSTIAYFYIYGFYFFFVIYSLIELLFFMLFLLMTWYLYKKLKLSPKNNEVIATS